MQVAIRTANFLSGGQSLADASARLSVMNQKKGNFPVSVCVVNAAYSMVLSLAELAILRL